MGEERAKLFEEVEEALESIRPYLQGDGGNITLLDITEDNVVKVRLEGSCKGCPLNLQTLKGGVEMVVKKTVPQIIRVDAVND